MNTQKEHSQRVSKIKLFSKQGISPVIATILLLAITVAISIITFQYLQNYSQASLETTNNNQILDFLQIRVVDVTSDTGYIQTPFNNLNISRVILDGVECQGNEGVATSRTLQINLTSCSSNVTSSRPVLTIETDQGIIQLDLSRRDLGVTTSVGGGFDCFNINGSWIEVPGSSYFGTSDFCVMQYEAKDDSGVATSEPSGTPWVNINFTDARAECSQLNSEYSTFDGTFRMITNREWMTIARNAEQQSTNWADGVIGSNVSSGGGLKRGNTGSLDSASYDGANPADRSIDTNTKAMLTLSNGETIWDLAGNIWEWTDMLENGSTFIGNVCSGPDNWYSYFGDDGFSICTFNPPFSKDSAADTRYEIGPLGDYNADNGVGRTNSVAFSGRVLLRGGDWETTDYTGAFTARFTNNPTVTFPDFGFRCSYEP